MPSGAERRPTSPPHSDSQTPDLAARSLRVADLAHVVVKLACSAAVVVARVRASVTVAGRYIVWSGPALTPAAVAPRQRRISTHC